LKPDFSYKITQRVKNYIEDNKMIRHGDSVIVGLSGGADSVCLFLILNRLKSEIGFDLHAVHINHCIRGESALRDEKFSYELSSKYGVPFIAYEIDVPKMAKAKGLTVEEAGRNARYACFADYAKDIISSDSAEYGQDANEKNKYGNNTAVKVAVAHHMDDQAETVIFNMVRGSGITGIGGMEPASERGLIRPILCLTREEIEEYLNFVNQDYCVDETNQDNDYSRNRIRNIVIPALEELQPRTAEHISTMADDAREIKEFVDSYVEAVFKKAVKPLYLDEQRVIGYSIDVDVLKSERPIIAKELIILTLRQLIETYKDITKKHITDIYELTYKGKGKMVNLPYGLVAERVKGEILLRPIKVS